MPKIIVKDHKYYFKIRGLGGPKGDKGDTGPAGPQGPQGPYVNVVAGTTTTLPAGSSAQVTVNNIGNTSTLNFGIPQGTKGDKGDAGTPGAQGPRGFAATVNVGETTTGQPGTNASVVNAGNEHDAVLKFTIPKGEKGETGETGPQGPTGGVKSTVVADLPETGESDKYYLVYRDSEGGTVATTDGYAQVTNDENAGDLTVSELYGNATQETLSGKNLLPPPADFNQTVSGVTVKCENGVYTFSGTATANGSTTARATVAQYTIQAGDYFHYCNSLASPNINIQLVFTDNTSFATSMNVTNRVFPIDNYNGTSYVGKTISSCRVNFASGSTFNGAAAPMILHNVSTVADYEPYVGGIPSPNPDYPQTVETVTGEQTVQVTGKNLLEITQSSVINQGTYVSGANTSTYTIKATGNDIFVNAVGAVGSTWSSSRGNLIPCNYGETIYFSTGNNDFQKNYFTEWDKNLVSLGYTLVSSSSGTYTPTNQDCKYVNLRFGNGNSVSDTTYTLSPIVCKTSNTAYEPYHGQSYEVNLGKNLLDNKATTRTYLGVTLTKNNDGSITLNGTSTGNAQFYLDVDGVGFQGRNSHLGAGTYTLNGRDSGGVKFEINYQTANGNSKYSHGTFTEAEPFDYGIYVSVTNGATVNNLRIYPQLERGSRATTYAPYFTPIELCKIGNYQDRIYKDAETSKWYIEKQVGKVVLPNTTGGYNSVSNWYYMGFTNLGIGAGAQDGGVMSNYFTMDGYSHMGTNTTENGAIATSATYIVIRNTACTDAESYRAWLGSNPTTVYYALATPTDTEITDSELIAQLDAVASLFPGVNNIWIIPSSGAQGELTGNYVVYDKYNRHKVYIWSSDDNTWQIILQ